MSQRTSKAARTAEASRRRRQRAPRFAIRCCASCIATWIGPRLRTGAPSGACSGPASTRRRSRPRAFGRYLLAQLNPLLTSAAASCNAIWISASAEIGISGGTSASRMRSFQGGFPPFTQSAE
jgi:hypothetical protein